MKKCDICGELFDVEEAETAAIHLLKNYDYFSKCLCADCVEKIVDDEEEYEYFEECEVCGTRYDYYATRHEFDAQSDLDIDDFGYLCLECALKKAQEEESNWVDEDDEF